MHGELKVKKKTEMKLQFVSSVGNFSLANCPPAFSEWLFHAGGYCKEKYRTLK
jgi:hypothetical protein